MQVAMGAELHVTGGLHSFAEVKVTHTAESVSVSDEHEWSLHDGSRHRRDRVALVARDIFSCRLHRQSAITGTLVYGKEPNSCARSTPFARDSLDGCCAESAIDGAASGAADPGAAQNAGRHLRPDAPGSRGGDAEAGRSHRQGRGLRPRLWRRHHRDDGGPEVGARAVGIDIDPQRVKESTERITKAGVTDKVKDPESGSVHDRHQRSLGRHPLSPAVAQSEAHSEVEQASSSRARGSCRRASTWAKSILPEKTLDVNGRSVYLWTIPMKKR